MVQPDHGNPQLAVDEPDTRVRRLGRDLRAVLPSWITARLLLVVAAFLAKGVAAHDFHGLEPFQLGKGLAAWDGSFYLDLSRVGYAAMPRAALRFFPLYPLIGRALAPVAGGHLSALVIVANVASLVAGVLVRRLVMAERDDPALADRAVWITNLFPASFVLVFAYSESVFLALVVGCFLCARRGRFGSAGVLAALAALTRPVGVLLVAPLAVEAVQGWGRAGAADRARRIWAVLAAPAGMSVYLGWVGSTFGDATAPFRVQEQLRGSADPVSRLFRGIGQLFGPQRFSDGLHIPFAFLFVALLVVVARRWPLSYTVYAALVLVAALSANNLNSIERYALSAFPLLFALADVTSSRRAEWLALAVCGNGFVAMAALAWLGVYVP
ncbi:MAG TPA: hypothetical protein VMT43_11465 [Acidimicrobiales bacterium]|nr:hypothetical protein [Acidimicrobiales bacterium]